MEYIIFDVDKIKDYVFESFRPKEVKGASELIKCLDYYSDREMGEVMRKLKKEFPGVNVVYAKGGGGLLETKDSEGEKICRWLEQHFQEDARGGQVTAVWHNEKEEFNKNTYDILTYNIRKKKSEKVLYNPLLSFEFTKDNPRCGACGKRPSEGKPKIISDEEIPYCAVCSHKREYLEKMQKNKKKAETEAETLEDITRAPHVKETKNILVIYGDLNEAGAHLAALSQKHEIANFSETVYQTLNNARQEIETLLQEKRFKSLMPVVGGDDLIIFTHPNSFELIKDKLFSIEETLRTKLKKPVRMNFSFLLAKHNFPIYHLFKISESLLQLTKDAYYSDLNKQTRYGFFWLWEGDYRPKGEDVYIKKEFADIFNLAERIHQTDSGIRRSSLHTILEMVSNRYKGQEKQLNMEYYLARHSEFENFILQKDKGVDFFLTCEDLKIRLTRDIVEDIINMENLFYRLENKNKEER